MGADGVLNVADKDPKTLAAQAVKLLERAPDQTIECSGSEASIQLGIYVRGHPKITSVSVGGGVGKKLRP